MMRVTDDEWEDMRRVLTGTYGEQAGLMLGYQKLKVQYDWFIDPGTKETVLIQPYVMHRVFLFIAGASGKKREHEEWFVKFYEAGTDTIRFVYVQGARSYIERRINPVDPSTGQRLFAPSRLYV